MSGEIKHSAATATITNADNTKRLRLPDAPERSSYTLGQCSSVVATVARYIESSSRGLSFSTVHLADSGVIPRLVVDSTNMPMTAMELFTHAPQKLDPQPGLLSGARSARFSGAAALALTASISAERWTGLAVNEAAERLTEGVRVARAAKYEGCLYWWSRSLV
jgi:hypothetical protein